MTLVRPGSDGRVRCDWAASASDLMVRYHDEEWGVPLHNERGLFEFLILEGAQAGLSWATILNKRDHYRKAFDDFDPRKVARYNERKVNQLLDNAGIVRNKLKIAAAITNAKAYLALQEEFGSFDAYLQRFARPTGKPPGSKSLPARSAQSDALSKDLARRGFKFVGSTICYAFMQAVGLVNDHRADCFRRAEISMLS
jgi:DNA-3-methyladenine glycosylase I